MKSKNNRLDSIKMIISSKEIGNQGELLAELEKEGFQLTQATLSRDLKQLKVAKAASMNGNYVYVLPNTSYPLNFRETSPSSRRGPDMPAVWLTISTTIISTKLSEPLPEMTPLCWYCAREAPAPA